MSEEKLPNAFPLAEFTGLEAEAQSAFARHPGPRAQIEIYSRSPAAADCIVLVDGRAITGIQSLRLSVDDPDDLVTLELRMLPSSVHVLGQAVVKDG